MNFGKNQHNKEYDKTHVNDKTAKQDMAKTYWDY